MCSIFVLFTIFEYACILALFKCQVKMSSIQSRCQFRDMANYIDCIFGTITALAFMIYNMSH